MPLILQGSGVELDPVPADLGERKGGVNEVTRIKVTPSDGDASPSGNPGCSDGASGATGGAGAMAMTATSTLSLPMSQGKPSLRRIKGRIHRSKSLDSMDLLDANVRLTHH
ncbi:unnamed protein product [Pleuronectes platessa]|uniref:Uncharacterized protein n=1 Tax=Pleuronectes platessa TaxID=8262 RepID=A0A9N7UT41_PLEPL|nr:unnamed protein product [Pleuronectes platessa]